MLTNTMFDWVTGDLLLDLPYSEIKKNVDRLKEQLDNCEESIEIDDNNINKWQEEVKQLNEWSSYDVWKQPPKREEIKKAIAHAQEKIAKWTDIKNKDEQKKRMLHETLVKYQERALIAQNIQESFKSSNPYLVEI